MGRSRALLWVRAAGGLVAAALGLALTQAPLPVRLPLPLSVALGVLVGTLLFVALARRMPTVGIARGRLGLFTGKLLFLVVNSAVEEVLWRRLLVGTLVGLVGAVAAVAVGTVGFALSHAHWQRRRGFVVHLATGAVFGTLFVATGSVAAAAAAHASYNVLIASAVERLRRRAAPRRVPLPPPDPALAASLEGVHKSYGAAEALRGLDLDVRPGEVVALLGANGAGKTTAVSVLLGLRRAHSGRAMLFGAGPRVPASRACVGSTPQEIDFPPGLRVREVVDLVAAHYRDAEPAGPLLERFGLTGLERRQCGGLSGGERRRLAVALAFVGRPRVVFLDEPTAGLDVETRRIVWEEIRGFGAAGGAVLLTTHHLEEVEAIASRIVVVADGKAVAAGTVAEIKAGAGLKRVRLDAQPLPPLDAVVRAERENGSHVLYTEDVASVVRELVRADVALGSLEVLPVSLEDAFLVLTGSGA